MNFANDYAIASASALAKTTNTEASRDMAWAAGAWISVIDHTIAVLVFAIARFRERV